MQRAVPISRTRSFQKWTFKINILPSLWAPARKKLLHDEPGISSAKEALYPIIHLSRRTLHCLTNMQYSAVWQYLRDFQKTNIHSLKRAYQVYITGLPNQLWTFSFQELRPRWPERTSTVPLSCFKFSLFFLPFFILFSPWFIIRTFKCISISCNFFQWPGLSDVSYSIGHFLSMQCTKHMDWTLSTHASRLKLLSILKYHWSLHYTII